MQLELPDSATRATIEIDCCRVMTNDEYFDFCMRNQGLHVERETSGDIIIMPPAGCETGYRNNEIARQLGNWSIADGRGVALDPQTEYLLPSGAAYAPDASWVLRSRLAAFTKQQKQRFLPLCPDFVVELISPGDRLSRAKVKMQEWIENGAQLAWLIDADRRTIYIYRPDRSAEERTGVEAIAGEGPAAGFMLDLRAIWEGI